MTDTDTDHEDRLMIAVVAMVENVGPSETLEALADAWNGIAMGMASNGDLPSHVRSALEMLGRDIDDEALDAAGALTNH